MSRIAREESTRILSFDIDETEKVIKDRSIQYSKCGCGGNLIPTDCGFECDICGSN